MAALVICLGGAFATAFWMKGSVPENELTAALSITHSAEKPPEKILSEIPSVTTNTTTDQAIRTALKKISSRPKEAATWVNLGDALAQKLRDTSDQRYYLHAEAVYRHALKLDSKCVEALT
ncbi:MAG: hypothetical protein CFE26_26380, partial [Verrucomicrobiales bacterium VVV1]